MEKTYGALYVAYSSKFYWWETVELLRKLVLTSIIVLIEPETATQLFVGCLLAFTCCLLYSEFKPYLFSDDDFLQLACQISVFITMFVGLIIKCGVDQEKAMQGPGLEILLVVLQVMPLLLGMSGIAVKTYSKLKSRIADLKAKSELMHYLRQPGRVEGIIKLKKLPKATHPDTGDVVAIKRIKRHFRTWEECLQLRELQSLKKLQHPNIVKLKQVVREEQILYFVFEFCETDLHRVIQAQTQRGTQQHAKQGAVDPVRHRQ